jgi:hypothetical protein
MSGISRVNYGAILHKINRSLPSRSSLRANMTEVAHKVGANYFRGEGATISGMKTLEAFQRASLIDGASLSQTRVLFKNFDEEAAFLRKMVTEYTGNAALREITIRVVFPRCRPKDEYAQALTIGQWVQDRTWYVHEGSELFQTPLTTIRLKAGDCDDYAILIASMLGCVGIRNKLCILKINGRWAHIFPVALVVDKGEVHRLTLDGTLLKRYDAGDHAPADDPVGDLINPIALVKARGDKCEAFFV